MDDEAVMQIDGKRSIEVRPVSDKLSLVLVLDDPHTVAVVELTGLEVDWLIEKLQEFRQEA